MASRLICDCRKRLPSGFEVHASLSMELERAPVLVLFGPSGAGKTTLLRLLAGLETPDEGSIVFNGETWFEAGQASQPVHLPPQKRRAGFLFQDYALFPHLTVEQNVAYAAHANPRDLLNRFGLDELAARFPRTLSGGQQQKVALARALAANPSLLLLDEPLSALDAAGRARVRVELRGMLRAARVPSIVVTHDRTEAMALGDCMAVMVDGRVRQTGAVQEVFRKPADAAVAAAVGMENVLPAEIAARDSGLLTVRSGPVRLQCIDSGEAGAVFACIRAEDVQLTRDPPSSTSARNRLAGVVVSVTVEGALARIELDCGVPLVALITAQSAAEMALRPHQTLAAIVKATSVHLVAIPPVGQDGILRAG